MNIREHIYFKFKIRLDLVYNENIIEKLKKRKHKTIDKDLSKERYNQYKLLLPKQFDNYYKKLSIILKEQLNNKIKFIILYPVSRQSNSFKINIGTNLNYGNDKVWIALGIEDSHYAMTYLYHEILHSYFLNIITWNKYQLELNHLLIEYFTDYKLYHLFTNIKNIYNDVNKIELFKLLDKEYKLFNLSATPFKDKVINDYKKYIGYIEKSKRWKNKIVSSQL